MKRMLITLALIAMLFTAATSNAGTCWIYGYVTDYTTGLAVVGAGVSILGVTVYTDATGLWYVQYHNYCGSKDFMVAKQGYYSKWSQVWDNSCAECTDPSCSEPYHQPPCPYTCAMSARKDVTVRRILQDIDSDGIMDADDNCPFIANGPAKGICLTGLVGRDCYKDGDCGCGKDCSLNQEDTDGDGIGDVCDSSPKMSSASTASSFDESHKSIVDGNLAPFFYFACMNNERFYENNQYLCYPDGVPEASSMEVAQAKAMELNPWLYNALGLFTLTFCQNNVCSYECLSQFIADIANGPEFAFGGPTHPDSPRPLPECPDVPNFVDFVNKWLNDMREFWYGDNFPPEN